jgi:hypothetical protein
MAGTSLHGRAAAGGHSVSRGGGSLRSRRPATDGREAALTCSGTCMGGRSPQLMSLAEPLAGR